MRLLPLVLVAALPLLLSAAPASITKKPELVVYSYESFVSKWGPGPEIQAAFEAECGCSLRWMNAEDGAALLTRLRMEGKNTKADVVLGLDSSLVGEAKATGLFVKPDIAGRATWKVPAEADPEGVFIPFDFGWFAFMHDTEKLKAAPQSMEDLLNNPAFVKKVIIQDPRTSTPGLGLLLWLKKIYGEKAPAAFKKLSAQTLTVTKGWSEAYGLFTKGEAPLVLSYTTSEAYHRAEEKTERYKALVFPEGHYLQIEVAGMLSRSPQKPLAQRFLQFLLQEKSQAALASKNWMYPVIDTATLKDIPSAFSQLPRPSRTLLEEGTTVAARRKAWVDEWLAAFRTK